MIADQKSLQSVEEVGILGDIYHTNNSQITKMKYHDADSHRKSMHSLAVRVEKILPM